MRTIKKFFQLALIFVCWAVRAENETFVGALPFDALSFSKANCYHFAKDQNLSDLIRDFFSMQGIIIVISNRVNYTVNGKFSKMEPAAVWNDMQRLGLMSHLWIARREHPFGPVVEHHHSAPTRRRTTRARSRRASPSTHPRCDVVLAVRDAAEGGITAGDAEPSA
jgi:type II secretory pathway component GspD/PulD (secretin)